jgi:uncharacterized protein (UPF0332 family)
LFAQYFVKTGLIEPEYGRMLGSTFNLRLDSDYDVGVSYNQAEADDAIRDAKRFVSRTETYSCNEEMLSL